MNIMGIVLAAGQGKRMKSKLYKVLHPVCGKPMVGHVVTALENINTTRTVVIVGHGAEAVQSYLGARAEYALQEKQLGTGHAVLQAKDLLSSEEGLTIVICGDTPLVSEETLQGMLQLHQAKGAAATILTAGVDTPHGYGRIIRDASGAVAKIVEEKDCSPEERQVQEINTGTYCFDNRKLFAALAHVKNDNTQNEYYITDVIGILSGQNEVVEGYVMHNPIESIGVNDRLALAEAERAMRERINKKHMLNGVTLIDPASTYIEADVQIGADTVILPGTLLKGSTVIGEDCIIGPQCDITDTTIANAVTVKQSVLQEAVVGSGTSVGPFAYLRPGADVGQNAKIGDFVEIKNAKLGDEVKVSHLSYIGDAVIGRNVNFGCGAITVNYDGFNKQLTEVEENAFVGCNVNLIAPVKVGKGAYVVAGSTITNNVEENDVAIARERQVNKPGYAAKLRAKFAAKKQASKAKSE
ncbi:bifunctional UDP-N-acetylglucosamine diphosphorylase/glucosamine-1-phosphate N-acetyltransferase GlmU [Paenibacillus cremeus]|uniref:Bifunctional protein GlmU n=1 Tax=Paenibacillus cremeus TaxID=2163881 RepID=A0A559K3V1_9BACL|nr:bifunctional UDP-N-acetylglucosamine diphosphorylase/glucosamine-1-phosphate N-acetyltransferase GlmU [Paenibacillus cremeus]TVY06804.1 bifunctional UDP-N-acetylglucosamine diphosphorylase/glucosamine-1-phosphate N-acetyltransferase GlmU [Paenibacillus cremeus]